MAMKVFTKGQRVTYTRAGTKYQGSVTDHFCEHGHFVGLRLDGQTSGFPEEISEDKVEPVTGDRTEELILLAETLEQARLQALRIGATYPSSGVYGSVRDALAEILGMICTLHGVPETDPEHAQARVVERIHTLMVYGTGVREALAAVLKGVSDGQA